MAEEHIEAIEAPEEEMTDEVAHYECAFHILPTVADEEVPGVVESLKALVTHIGGTITDEEVSERYDLAYDITKQVGGVNRRFNAAHFGWMRFMLAPSALPDVLAEIEHKPEVLRHLVIRLTRGEAQRPFSIFETRRAQDRLQAEKMTGEREARGETEGGISEEALDQSLDKITAE